jgi:hypothetical protein
MDRVVRVPLVEQELLTLSEHMSSSRRFLVGFVLLDL